MRGKTVVSFDTIKGILRRKVEDVDIQNPGTRDLVVSYVHKILPCLGDSRPPDTIDEGLFAPEERHELVFKHSVPYPYNDEIPPKPPSYDRCLDFAVRICRAACILSNGEQNVLFSPLCAEAALCAMHLTAADQISRDQIGAVLGLTENVRIDQVVDGMEDASQAIAKFVADFRGKRSAWLKEDEVGTLELNYANAVFSCWPDEMDAAGKVDEHVSGMTLLKQEAGLEVWKLDSENHAQIISDYVMDKCRIQDFVPKKDWKVEAGTVTLVNTIHFRGQYESSFYCCDDQAVFTLDDGSCMPVDIRMGHMTCECGVLKELEGAEMLRLQYGRGTYEACNAFILLPNKKGSLNTVDKLLSKLTGPLLRKAIYEGLWMQSVHVQLPRVWVEQSYDMIPVFHALGLPSAFVSGVPVSNAFQKTSLGIADGTKDFTDCRSPWEAMLFDVYGNPIPTPINFHALHPFCIFIQEPETGCILYAGAIHSPSTQTAPPSLIAELGD